jgi:hypothetical protein
MNAYVKNVQTSKIVAWFTEVGDARLHASVENIKNGSEIFIVGETKLKFDTERDEAAVLMKDAIGELDKHIPVGYERPWIKCSCKHSVKPSAWVQHALDTDDGRMNHLVPALETINNIERKLGFAVPENEDYR